MKAFLDLQKWSSQVFRKFTLLVLTKGVYFFDEVFGQIYLNTKVETVFGNF